MKLLEHLGMIGACQEARVWVGENQERSAQQTWEACTRADWLVWVCFQHLEREVLLQVLSACLVAARDRYAADVRGLLLQAVPSADLQQEVARFTTDRYDLPAQLEICRGIYESERYVQSFFQVWSLCATLSSCYNAEHGDSETFRGWARASAVPACNHLGNADYLCPVIRRVLPQAPWKEEQA